MTDDPGRRFVDQVRRQLSDLPAEIRDDLVAELEQHLAQADTPDMSAGQYASELRRAAGLPAPPRVQPRLIAVAVVMMLVAALGVVGYMWARHYQPLQFGDGCFRSDPAGEDVSVGTSRERRLVYDDAAAVRVVWTLSNPGSRTVTVSNLTFPTAQWGVDNISVGIGPADNQGECASPPGTSPADSFDLRPGEFRSVVLTGTFAGCEHYRAGGAAGIENVHATISVLGISHNVDLRLHPALSIQFPDSQSCPR